MITPNIADTHFLIITTSANRTDKIILQLSTTNHHLFHIVANNDTMDSLDLSWNHLRRDGGVLVAEGLAVSLTFYAKKLAIKLHASTTMLVIIILQLLYTLFYHLQQLAYYMYRFF